MKNKYVSPDMKFLKFHIYDDILTGSDGTTEQYDDSDMDSNELFG